MTTTTTEPWDGIVQDARRYPSPHNSQPIKLRPIDAERAELFYDLDLGLPAESFGIPFGHVCAGVFLESLAVVAAAEGFAVEEHLDTGRMDFAGAHRLHPLGSVVLRPRAATPEDAERRRVFLGRRTSRRPYDAAPVPERVVRAAERIAAGAGHAFRTTTERRLVDDLVRINQRTLFSDLRNDAVHAEIMTWLRFSRGEAAVRGDGLSAETMLMPGPVLRFAMGHRGLWEAPVVGAAIRGVYLNTMRGVRQLAWLEGPFGGPADHIEAGRTFMRIWLALAAEGVVLHPFGTVITNPDSHRAFARVVQADEGGDRMAWMLFRYGYSAPPPLAHRRPASAMLVGAAS